MRQRGTVRRRVQPPRSGESGGRGPPGSTTGSASVGAYIDYSTGARLAQVGDGNAARLPSMPSCPGLFHCCPVKMGRTRCKALVQAGFRPVRTCPFCPPAVTPALSRGPGLLRTPIRGKPGDGGACGPGPRLKAGVTAGGGDNVGRGGHPPAPLSRHARTCSGHPRPSAASPAPAYTAMPQDVDARNKSGHDGGGTATGETPVRRNSRPGPPDPSETLRYAGRSPGRPELNRTAVDLFRA